jgi:predicted NUDIX family phosphoesterase
VTFNFLSQKINAPSREKRDHNKVCIGFDGQKERIDGAYVSILAVAVDAYVGVAAILF